MKNFILLVLALCGICHYAPDVIQKTKTEHVEVREEATQFNHKPAISVDFVQDVSVSGELHGVEIISSSVFTPYYNAVNRNVELHFGVVDNLTADKLVSIILPAKNFVPPILPKLTRLSETEKRQEKERYLISNKQYTEDSIQFYLARSQNIELFRNKVDSLLSKYRNNLSKQTDLITAVDIADKVFNYSVFGATKNYLLLNTDGYDTFHRKASKLRNTAEVILINADKKSLTSIDSIITLTLQSPEQAIQFTLNN